MEFHPANKILVRRIEEEEGSGEEEMLSLSLKYRVKGSLVPSVVSLKRPRYEPWSSTLSRLQAKLISKKKMKRKQRPTADEDPMEGIVYDGPPIELIQEEDMVAMQEEPTLDAVLSSAGGLRIGDVAFAFAEEAGQVSKASLRLTPMVGFPLVARVLTAPEEMEDSVEVSWYRDEVTIKASKPKFVLDTAVEEEKAEGSQRRLKLYDWERLEANGRVCIPRKEDLKRRIGFVADLGENTIAKASEAVEVRAGVEEELAWEERQNLHTPTLLSEPATYRIVCYNILADLYLNLTGAQEDLWFPYCPKDHLKASYRYPLILRELPGYNADILALQEVDASFWHCYLRHVLAAKGYEAVFARKGGSVAEGALIAVRKDRLKIFATADRLLVDVAVENPEIVAHLSQAEWYNLAFTSRPTTLQTVLIGAPDDSDEPLLLVGNTHLHSLPSDDHIRVLQVEACLRHLSSTRERLAKDHPNRPIRTILCGDLNNVGGSPALNFLETGTISDQNPVWTRPQNILTPDVEIGGITLSHDFKLRNLSEGQDFSIHCYLKGQPFVASIDHIYAEDSLRLLKLAPPPRKDLMNKYTAIPSKIAPSDHVPIIADFFLS